METARAILIAAVYNKIEPTYNQTYSDGTILGIAASEVDDFLIKDEIGGGDREKARVRALNEVKALRRSEDHG